MKRSVIVFGLLFGVLFGTAEFHSLKAQTDNPTLLNKQVVQLFRKGKYAEAIAAATRVLQLVEEKHGSAHPAVFISINNVAVLHFKLGRFAEAEQLLKRGLATLEKTYAADHPEVGELSDTLGDLYDLQGRFRDAEPFYRRNLAIKEKALGPNHISIAMPLGKLARLYQNQGRSAMAVPLLKRSVDLLAKLGEAGRPAVIGGLNRLAGLYEIQGLWGEAEAAYRRSLSIAWKTYGADHSAVTSTRANLALLLRNRASLADIAPVTRQPVPREITAGRRSPDATSRIAARRRLASSQDETRATRDLIRAAAATEFRAPIAAERLQTPPPTPVKYITNGVSAAAVASAVSEEKAKWQAQVRILKRKLRAQAQKHLASVKSLKAEVQLKLSAIEKAHSTEVSQLRAALSAQRKQLTSQTAAQACKQSPPSDRDDARSARFQSCLAERAQLRTQLRGCESARRELAQSARRKRGTAVARRCGLSKGMIRELNR